MKNDAKGIKRLINASRYSWQGIVAAYVSEEAFRLEIWFAAILVPVGLWLGEDGVEKTLLSCSVLLIIIVELLNSAVESVVDRFGPEWNQFAGQAKDMGSAAVLTSIIVMLISWLLILFF